MVLSWWMWKKKIHIADKNDVMTKAIKEKKIAIANTIINLANSVASILRAMPTNRKRLFQKKNRRPMRKQKQRLGFAKVAMQLYMSKMQIDNIIQQPIPRFPQGSESQKGIAIVGNEDKEEIILRKPSND